MQTLLTVPQCAPVLGVSDVQAWRLARDKKLRAMRIGRRYLVKPADLCELVEKRLRERAEVEVVGS